MDITTALSTIPDPDVAGTAASAPPLAVDLDGTLINIDSLHESFISCLRFEPEALHKIAGGLHRGKAAFRAEV